jgi:mxaA protein
MNAALSCLARRAAPLLLLGSAIAGAAPPPRIELATPRDYGYTMGDLVEQAVTVEVPEAYTLETGFLPRPGALDENLELRSSTWEESRHDGQRRYRITLQYQVFKGVRAPEAAKLMPWMLRLKGPAPMQAEVPEWNYTVIPLIPPALADEAVRVRDPLPPEPLPVMPHLWRVLAYGTGLLALLAGWAWRQYGATARNRPFARAYRELRRLARGPLLSGEAQRAAAKRLHRALDETAGHTLFPEQLTEFCLNRPAFAHLREELAGFFAWSRHLFFAPPELPPAANLPPPRLLELCRRCARAERGRL